MGSPASHAGSEKNNLCGRCARVVTSSCLQPLFLSDAVKEVSVPTEVHKGRKGGKVKKEVISSSSEEERLPAKRPKLKDSRGRWVVPKLQAPGGRVGGAG